MALRHDTVEILILVVADVVMVGGRVDRHPTQRRGDLLRYIASAIDLVETPWSRTCGSSYQFAVPAGNADLHGAPFGR